MPRHRQIILICLAGLLMLSACNMPQDTSKDDFATAMSAYATASPTAETAATAATAVPSTAAGEPSGQIVYTCQTTYQYNRNQLCLINPDGSGLRRLTFDDQSDHYFASFAPDGLSIVFSSNLGGSYEIYELDLAGGEPRQIANSRNNFAPAVSPDGTQIIFTHNSGPNLQDGQIWIINRDGSDSHRLTNMPGGAWDPVWSPDGSQIMFASRIGGTAQMVIANTDGSDPLQVTDLVGLRGRNDWSINDVLATYIGTSWNREIISFFPDGSQLFYLTDGGNNLAPSFSPDGNWIVFTSYRDNYRDDNGCEIYIMRTTGNDVQRLTENDYCDWQPRWGGN